MRRANATPDPSFERFAENDRLMLVASQLLNEYGSRSIEAREREAEFASLELERMAESVLRDAAMRREWVERNRLARIARESGGQNPSIPTAPPVKTPQTAPNARDGAFKQASKTGNPNPGTSKGRTIGKGKSK